MSKSATAPDREFTVAEGLVYMFGAIGVLVFLKYPVLQAEKDPHC